MTVILSNTPHMPDTSISAVKSVLQIFSLHYSGSSILNLLLDQQEGIRGLGECYHIYGRERECYCSCGRHLKNCLFFASISAENFYEQCFSRYDCHVIVDASKIWGNFAAAQDLRFPCYAVLLSKTPHAWLYSYMQHHPDDTRDVATMFKEYVFFYRQTIEQLTKKGIPFDVVTYDALASNPYVECQRLCRPLGVSVDPHTMTGPWTTDTHIAGGNHAVYQQLQAESSYFDASSKYRHKKGVLFLDEAWRQDHPFRLHCVEAYTQLESVLDPVLRQLGHCASVDLVIDVQLPPLLQPVALT